MKFLIEECLSPRVAKALSDAGWDTVHAERGLDEEVLSCAFGEGRSLISVDTDFGEMLIKSGASSPSVLLLRRSEHRPERQVELILANLPSVLEDLASGAIVVLTPDHIRVRSHRRRFLEAQPDQFMKLYAKIAKPTLIDNPDVGSDSRLVDRMIERLPTNAKVLDVGCGAGAFTKYRSCLGDCFVA